MTVAKTRNVLSGMQVKEAMRRQVVIAAATEIVNRAVPRMIKYKSDVLLISDSDGHVAGIVSKTDLAAAFYAGLSVDTALGDIMAGPLIGCYPDDPLEDALEIMGNTGVHQLCVRGADPGRIEGLLTYGDILGLVYRYCRRCRQSHARHHGEAGKVQLPAETLVADVMREQVIRCNAENDLVHVMEALSDRRMSAALVIEETGRPCGVISKTDLVMAWHRGVDPGESARSVMNAPVRSCHKHATLTEAMTMMLLGDMGRIFVHDPDPGRIVGVLSLAAAASQRSGTCRACVSSRMLR
jgi:CBS domain-containing protein